MWRNRESESGGSNQQHQRNGSINGMA